MGVLMNRRLILVRVTGDCVASIIAHGRYTIDVQSTIPSGAQFVTAHYAPELACFLVCLTHPDLPDIAEGAKIPILPMSPTVTAVERMQTGFRYPLNPKAKR